jgi:hypothetical protein
MKTRRKTQLALSLMCALTCGASAIRAQDRPSAPEPQTQSPPTSTPPPESSRNPGTTTDQRQPGGDILIEPVMTHRFWDTTNDLLFAGVGASRTLDYFSTLNMRRRGRQEILLTNDVVDNHAAFAVIEAAGTATSIGVSYLFHHYGHHSLERWTSIIHIGLATTGGVRNYCLKTAHPATAAPVNATFGLVPATFAH